MPDLSFSAFVGRVRQVAEEKSVGKCRAGTAKGVYPGEGHLKNKGPGTPAENTHSGWEKGGKRNFKKHCF